MAKLTRIREALVAALPDDLDAEALTGPQEAAPTFGGGLGPARMVLRVYVGAPDDAAAQKLLDQLLDPEENGSVPTFLYGTKDEPADQTLGGLVKGLQIVGSSGWRIYRAGDGSARLGAEWTIQTK